MYEGADRVRGRWEVRGREGGRWGFGRKEKRREEEVGEGENFEEKGMREKEEILLVLRGEDGNKGVGVGEGWKLTPCPPPHVC